MKEPMHYLSLVGERLCVMEGGLPICPMTTREEAEKTYFHFQRSHWPRWPALWNGNEGKWAATTRPDDYLSIVSDHDLSLHVGMDRDEMLNLARTLDREAEQDGVLLACSTRYALADRLNNLRLGVGWMQSNADKARAEGRSQWVFDQNGTRSDTQ